MKIKQIIYFLILEIYSLFSMCSYQQQNIPQLVRDPDACKRIKGYMLIAETKDTAYLRFIFEGVPDRKITHCAKYYGKSVLWGKVQALKAISCIDHPGTADIQPPDSVFFFYKNWAIKEGYIKE